MAQNDNFYCLILKKIIQLFWMVGLLMILSACVADPGVKKAQITQTASVPAKDWQAPTSAPTRSEQKIIKTPTTWKLFIKTQEFVKSNLDLTHWQFFDTPLDIVESNILHIAQTTDGVMWFVGWKIYCFDGKVWTVFDPKEIPVFQNRSITALAASLDGKIWFGTTMNELVSFDGSRWETHIVDGKGSFKNKITTIIFRKNGELCAVYRTGMSCLYNNRWKSHPIQEEIGQAELRTAVLTTFDEIWAPTDYGVVYLYDGVNWIRKQVVRSSGVNGPGITVAAASQDGAVWVDTVGGLGKMDREGNIIYKFMDIISYPKFINSAIYQARDGSIWFGTGGHYQLAQYKNGEFKTADGKILYAADGYDFPSNDIPFGRINDIFEAKDGTIWFGTFRGIFRYSPQPLPPTSAGERLNPRSEVTQTPPYPLPKLDENCWKHIHENNDQQLGEALLVRKDPQGAIWVLYWNGLVRRFEGQQTTYYFRELTGCKTCLANASMSLLPNGEIWIGSMEGLLHFNKGQMEFVSDTKILPLQARILEWRVLAGTPAGDIWVSDQQNNVCRLNQGWKCFQPIQEDPADTVLSAAFVGENHLWFGSRSGRFLEYNQGTWKTYQISRLFQQPYKTQKIGSMAYDPKSGMLWALETSMPQKEPGTGAVPGIGLITRTKDGKWNLLEKSFFDRFKDNNFNGVLKTIAVDQNSHAWIGMIDRYGVVEYDGSGWKTMAGEKLPIKPAFFQYEEERHHQDTKCQLLQDDYIIDLDTPAQGGLLVLNNLGVFQYQGLPK